MARRSADSDSALRRLELESGIRAALEHDELRLAFQPVVRCDTGRVAFLEALVRWQHPQHGLVPPGVFLPVAVLGGPRGGRQPGDRSGGPGGVVPAVLGDPESDLALLRADALLGVAVRRRVAPGGRLLELRARGFAALEQLLALTSDEAARWWSELARPVFELGVEDTDRAREFYGALCDWEFEPGPTGAGLAITTTTIPGGMHGGDAGATPYVFFAVDDMEAALQQVRDLGGEVEDADVEGDAESVATYGRFMLCRDDQGSPFGLHQRPTGA